MGAVRGEMVIPLRPSLLPSLLARTAASLTVIRLIWCSIGQPGWGEFYLFSPGRGQSALA